MALSLTFKKWTLITALAGLNVGLFADSMQAYKGADDKNDVQSRLYMLGFFRDFVDAGTAVAGPAGAHHRESSLRLHSILARPA